MAATTSNSFGTRSTLNVGGVPHTYYSLPALDAKMGGKVSRLPFSLRVLLENMLRKEDGIAVRAADIDAVANWKPKDEPDFEISFMPARVLLQDFTGVPAVVDLAAMRDAMAAMGGDPRRISPLQQVDLVIDHSVQVDEYGSAAAELINTKKEFARNGERYTFLRWGQRAFDNFRVVPPDTGIVHQVNLEYLAHVAYTSKNGVGPMVYPDSLVGTDSHTTMINGLGVLGWGVGGIEAEAAMLGQPISMLLPQVVGFKVTGKLPLGATATDLVLTATQMLRKKGVVAKFVEFYGPGLSSLPLADRATIANMAPEYGATVGFFPVDAQTIEYLKLSGRPAGLIQLVEEYYKAQGLFRTDDMADPEFSDTLSLDLSTVEPSLAGPKRPQDRVLLSKSKGEYRKSLVEMLGEKGVGNADKESVAAFVAAGANGTATDPDIDKLGNLKKRQPAPGTPYSVSQGDVVIAAITSCTNTSNPSVLIGAGLLARNAVRRGLTRQPWVKTSLAPGSRVVTEYLKKSGLLKDLEAVGFHVVGYGCTTCIGNSGPLPVAVSQAITDGSLCVAAVLSGNRNFEGRVNPQTRMNYLASPPLVVAYALAGTMDIDFNLQAIGKDKDGKPVYLKDIWPDSNEIQATIETSVNGKMFEQQYADVFLGDENWQKLPTPEGSRYTWAGDSTYVKQPPYFVDMPKTPKPIKDIIGGRVLAVLGDSVTTDHISPAGDIPKKSPAGQYLMGQGVAYEDFNSYGSRRGNHEVMMRGTFANIRLKNLMLPGTEGGITAHQPSGEQMSIYDAAMKYQAEGVPLVIFAGKEYGSGSSRDWAAKGPALQGVRAVAAESFERIHRSNLIGMGILPLQFPDGQTAQSLMLDGTEVVSISGLEAGLKPKMTVRVVAKKPDGAEISFNALVRIDTPNEAEYYRHGGILHYVLRQLVAGK